MSLYRNTAQVRKKRRKRKRERQEKRKKKREKEKGHKRKREIKEINKEKKEKKKKKKRKARCPFRIRGLRPLIESTYIFQVIAPPGRVDSPDLDFISVPGNPYRDRRYDLYGEFK